MPPAMYRVRDNTALRAPRKTDLEQKARVPLFSVKSLGVNDFSAGKRWAEHDQVSKFRKKKA